jgi:hypothetical protein
MTKAGPPWGLAADFFLAVADSGMALSRDGGRRIPALKLGQDPNEERSVPAGPFDEFLQASVA